MDAIRSYYVPLGAKFCSECGRAASDSSATPERFGSAARYTPRHLAQKILTSKSALEGERKQVTVLFADVKGRHTRHRLPLSVPA